MSCSLTQNSFSHLGHFFTSMGMGVFSITSICKVFSVIQIHGKSLGGQSKTSLIWGYLISHMISFNDGKNFDPACLLPLFEQSSWARGRTLPDAQEMVKHTNLFVTAWDESRLVGCGRVLTDYVYRASIWDVIVDMHYQGRDIGKEIINRILTHPTLQRVELFWLCTRNKQAFYESLGFSAKEQTGMVWDRTRQEALRSLKA